MVIGFVTGKIPLPVATNSDELQPARITVFVPSTPLPTTGWLLFVEPAQLVHLEMSVEEGMKLLLSGGALQTTPPNQPRDTA